MSKTVAVIGGGYGGTAVAKALDAEAEVILIDPKDAFVHSAGSLRALVRPDWAENIFFRYETLLQRGEFVAERAESVTTEGLVTLASGRQIAADYVVLATGSGYPYPAKFETASAAEALLQLRATHEELASSERVLIVGAGPVGLELAGEIRAVWPQKRIVVTDPAEQLLPGFATEVREALHRQLDELDIELRLGAGFVGEPATEPGQRKPFTVGTAGPDGEFEGDIWFRCYGVSLNSGYLTGELAEAITTKGQLRVTETLNVRGHDRIYAIGDLTDLAEAKMAAYAMQHAETVAQNILAQVRGERPSATYTPNPVPSLLLPLGPNAGVGQFPTPDGPMAVPAETVAEYKGRDLFTGRFAELFGTTAG